MRSKLFFFFLTVIAAATLCSAQITSTTMVGTTFAVIRTASPMRKMQFGLRLTY